MHLVPLLTLALLTSACLPLTRPVVKIGLVAPFEGRYRDVGYEVIYAVRLAVREANAAGGVAGYSVELVAFDDSGDEAQARRQALKLGTDPAVMGAIGHWLEATTLAAAPAYAEAGMALMATASSPTLDPGAFRLWLTEASFRAEVTGGSPITCFGDCGGFEDLTWLAEARAASPGAPVFGPPLWEQNQFWVLAGEAAEGVRVVVPAPLPEASADPDFAARYLEISNGVGPRAFAVLAYDATRVLIEAIAHDIGRNGEPTRAGTRAALTETTFAGLSGNIRFDSELDWKNARGWVYRWSEGRLVKP